MDFNEIIQPSVGADLSRPSPIYRAHRRFIGPGSPTTYPDEIIKPHYGAWGWGKTHIHLFISIIALEKANKQL